MSNILAGYKGNSGRELTEIENRDFDDLTEITKNLSADIVGKILIDWYEWLSARMGTDTGYFYCPYIPLMETTVMIDPDTLNKVELKVWYDKS